MIRDLHLPSSDQFTNPLKRSTHCTSKQDRHCSLNRHRICDIPSIQGLLISCLSLFAEYGTGGKSAVVNGAILRNRLGLAAPFSPSIPSIQVVSSRTSRVSYSARFYCHKKGGLR
jgi:hypothetical protein